ncbi:hypothetical protein I3843_01G088800 [Carya illinoinensis]|nr:hypothetical protein I3843_01G088800 [Carya illinoinensis]
MRNAKVRPVMNIPDKYHCSSKSSAAANEVPLQLMRAVNNFQENGGGGDGIRSSASLILHARDFWYARRAFLNSYHFSEEKIGFKHNLKRSVKELSQVAAGVVREFRREMSKRRLGIRVYRLTVSLPSLFVLVTIRCFTPWFNKTDHPLP